MPPNEQAPKAIPPGSKSFVQFMLKAGNGFHGYSPQPAEELRKEIVDNGGAGRTGYAKISTMPAGTNKSETLYVCRQEIGGFIIVELAEPSMIVVPSLVPPSNLMKQ